MNRIEEGQYENGGFFNLNNKMVIKKEIEVENELNLDRF